MTPTIQLTATALGPVQYRRSGLASWPTHVLLHGIGSGSASWQAQLQAAQGRTDLQLVAWEAPGYGQSAALPAAAPLAQDYAESLWAWLDALQAQQPLVLVGHSLGALIAASAARLRPDRVARLILLSPAQGYGDAPAEQRDKMLHSRLDNLQRLGPQGMAQARAPAMLSPSATAEQVATVRSTMAQIHPAGYSQACHMLAGGRLLQDLTQLGVSGNPHPSPLPPAGEGADTGMTGPQVASLLTPSPLRGEGAVRHEGIHRFPIIVASGEADGITPPAACQRVAQHLGQAWISLGPVGHACALEGAAAVNRLLGLSPVPTSANTVATPATTATAANTA